MRILIVSYAFPPVGGAGVQRMLKLVKYLPSHGVTPSVLSVRRASAPLIDASLEREIPPGLEVLRARTLEPEYAAKRLAWQASADGSNGLVSRVVRGLSRIGRSLLVPDPQILWLPGAARVLATRLRARTDDVVLLSAPPFSQFLLAPLIANLSRVPVVLDYRDEWTTTSSVYEMSGSSQASARLERAVLQRASVITTATEEFRSALLARFEFLDPDRVIVIPNGYDPADFPADLPEPPSDRLVLSYTGTVFRMTCARGFLNGLQLFHERAPELARTVEVCFAGRIVETEAPVFEGSEKLGVRRLGYLEHENAVRQLAQSHVPLCILDDVPGANRLYPAKIFEFMRIGRHCLILAPEGALTALVRRHRVGEVVPPRDAPAIAAALERLAVAFRNGQLGSLPGAVDIERFDRKRQAGEFARVLELARTGSVARPATGPSAAGVTLGQGERVRHERGISAPVAHVVHARAD